MHPAHQVRGRLFPDHALVLLCHKQSLILRSRASGVSKDEATIGASWFETALTRLLSDCLGSQAFCHERLFLKMALRMVRSFLATAIRAPFFGLPR